MRDPADPSNAITFLVPVTVVNLASTAESVTRVLSFHADLNGEEVWTSAVDVTVLPEDPSPPAGVQAPSHVGTVLMNDLEEEGEDTLLAGNSVVYRVEMSCPPVTWCNFDTMLSGDSSIGEIY